MVGYDSQALWFETCVTVLMLQQKLKSDVSNGSEDLPLTPTNILHFQKLLECQQVLKSFL